MQKINLRLASDEDREFLRNIRNKNRRFFFKKNYITKFQHNKWLQQQFISDNCFIFIIENFQSQKKVKIGTISLVDVDFKQKTAALGRFIIAEKYRCLGFAKLVIEKFKKICRSINVSNVCLSLEKNNRHAFGIYLKSNFKVFKKIGKRIYMCCNI